ncbi:Holliday junction branch migration protein RuvA [Candidatus Parcubacteria bacterium]|nr:Holliday junction branch migration protein RuvA [Candidatus Parcubacteria bacterium]
MISYLKGRIILKKDKFIVLDVNGVGYKVFLSQKTFDKIGDTDELLSFFCHLSVRENSLDLYGFLELEELDLFELVIGISGVGPKAALEISSIGPKEKLKEAIELQHEEIFEGILGIGQKKARKIILELSGKIKDFDSFISRKKETDPVLDTLINLGFPRDKAKQTLSGLTNIKDDEEKIKRALKILGK